MLKNGYYTNPNEVTKSEWDKLVKSNEWEIYTPEQTATVFGNLTELLKKGEDAELIKSTTAELGALTKYTVNEFVKGDIIKSDFYVTEKQIQWDETFEKSENGGNQTGVFLDTSLNRELNRVGETLEKGKKAVVKVEEKPEYDNDLVKMAMKYSKEDGATKTTVLKKMTESHPDKDKEVLKGCINKAYTDTSASYIEKAGMSYEEEESEEKEEKEEKK